MSVNCFRNLGRKGHRVEERKFNENKLPFGYFHPAHPLSTIQGTQYIYINTHTPSRRRNPESGIAAAVTCSQFLTEYKYIYIKKEKNTTEVGFLLHPERLVCGGEAVIW